MTILLSQNKCYNLISAGDILFSRSMGDPLSKREFPGQNGRVVAYEAVDSFPKTDALIRL